MGQRRRFARAAASYFRRLRVESLEDRRLLAVATVTTDLDVVDFSDGVTSLREAIFAANTIAGPDTIEFDFGHDGPATIVLTLGELVITDSLTINGPGPALLTIDASGNDPTPDVKNGDGSRVFLIDDGVKDNRFTVELRGLTITGGDSDDLRGGGIHSREHLTVRECVISGNAIRNAIGGEGTAGWGGGIQSLYGNLTVIDSTLTGNSATVAGGAIDFNRVSYDISLSIVNSTIEKNVGGVRGGGVLIAGDATITGTVIHDNEAGEGGGIAVWSNADQATISIENSQITSNRAGGGGGIYSASNAATFLIVGSAISGNEAVSIGGGILMRRSGPLAANAYSLEIRESTISGNLAAGGVGIFATDPTDGTGTAVKIEWSRIAENKFHLPSSGPAGGIATPRIARLVIADSVVESNDGMGIQARGVGQPYGVLKLERSHVRGNGHSGVYVRDLSSTLTDSTVTGNGDDGVSNHSGPLNVLGGSFSGNLGTGIYSHTGDVNIVGATITGNTSSQAGGGIYNFQGMLTVTSSTISGNASGVGGGGIHHGSNNSHSLRITDSTIRDNKGRRGGGIYTTEDAYIADSIIAQNRATIQGGGIASLDRVVLVRSAVSGNETTGNNVSGGGISALGAADLVLLVDSSVSNNVATGGGGGIHTIATVQLRRSNVSGNVALQQGGGGIFAPGRTISVIDSSVSGNRTAGPNSPGGGIMGGAVTISQSTLSGNRTEGLISFGGGINASSLALGQSTVANNRALGADSLGGGIYVSSTLRLDGSIVAGNASGGGNPDIRSGVIATASFALIGNTTGLTAAQLNAFSLGTGNQLNVDPRLGPLAYNGGPTFADGTRMLTHALLAGSPAIDAGDPQAERPVAMYRFEEAAGATTVEDLIGAQDGTYHGGATLEQAGSPFVGGHAVLFDGIDDYATVPATVANDFSFSLWLKTAQPTLSGVRIGLVDADAVNAVPGFGLYIENGRVVFRVAGLSIGFNMPINNGNWHHVAVTRNASTGASALYVDGVLRGSLAGGTTGPLADIAEWQIGRLIAGAGFFAGSLDELAVYDRELTAAEVARHAAAGVPVFDQRGEPHLRVLDGDEPDDIAIDIGAYEREFGETYTFVVDTLVDESDGDYSAGDFSLREAIELANLNPGTDVIEFDPALWAEGPATILLTMIGDESYFGRSALVITDAVVIDGPGAGLLTLDASGIDPTPVEKIGDGGRVLLITGPESPNDLEAVICGLTLTGGDSGFDGSTNANGGGIFALHMRLVLRDSVVSGNYSEGNGGGVYNISVNQSAESLIERTVIASNHALGAGGGLSASHGTDQGTVVRDSLIVGNRAEYRGGGIAGQSSSFYDVSFVLENSTVSGNIAGDGGGVYLGFDASRSYIRHSTITDNSATLPTGAGGVLAGFGEATLSHVIVAGNRNGAGLPSDLGRALVPPLPTGSFAVEYSLIGVNTNSGLDEAPIGPADANGNLIGGPVHGAIDPRLGPLAYNGGPTMTHALLPDSPALDAGEPLAMPGMDGVPEFDQRGMPWGRVANGDDVPEARIDMGAFEAQANPLAGDYNFDGVVDAADYSVWRDTLGSVVDLRADGDGDGSVDSDDYGVWKSHFGETLEQGAGSGLLAEIAASALAASDAVEPPAEPGADGRRGNVALTAVQVLQPPAGFGAFSNHLSERQLKPAGGAQADGLVRMATLHRDDALLAWMARQDCADASAEIDLELGSDEGEADVRARDELFAALEIAW